MVKQYIYFIFHFWLNISVEVGHVPATSPTKENKEAATSPRKPASDGRETATSIHVVPKNVKDLRQNPGYWNVDVFTYEEMRLATKLFRPDQILGEGGFGIVYKGVIDENVKPGYKTTQVAIKELNPEGFQGDREWLVFSGLILLISVYTFSSYMPIYSHPAYRYDKGGFYLFPLLWL